MARFYGILAVIGWVWLLVVIVFLAIRLRRTRVEPRGFDVKMTDPTNEKQS